MEMLLSAAGVAEAVEALAERIAPMLEGDAVVVALLTGAIWFAADLSRALSRRGCEPSFDSLWLASYGDGRESAGAVQWLAGPQRSLAGRPVLLVDDVLETGVSLRAARARVEGLGARSVRIAVFARKPFGGAREEPDFVGWEAPARFLVGYGMDDAGRLRGLPFVAALD